MKRIFDCGHRGKGKYCHRCAQVAQAAATLLRNEQEAAALKDRVAAEAECARKTALLERAMELSSRKKQLRAERKASALADPIDLSIVSHLPAVLSKAREIITLIASGTNCYALGGKRLAFTRNERISVPVGHRHKLILSGEPPVPIELLSHEDYNNVYCA